MTFDHRRDTAYAHTTQPTTRRHKLNKTIYNRRELHARFSPLRAVVRRLARGTLLGRGTAVHLASLFRRGWSDEGGHRQGLRARQGTMAAEEIKCDALARDATQPSYPTPPSPRPNPVHRRLPRRTIRIRTDAFHLPHSRICALVDDQPHRRIQHVKSRRKEHVLYTNRALGTRSARVRRGRWTWTWRLLTFLTMRVVGRK